MYAQPSLAESHHKGQAPILSGNNANGKSLSCGLIIGLIIRPFIKMIYEESGKLSIIAAPTGLRIC